MDDYKNIVVIQTAFLGDVILTLPLVQELKKALPASMIDLVVVPRAAELLATHPDIHRTIIYDKRKTDAGIHGFFRKRGELRLRHYDVALVPHRSLRSAALAAMASIPRRIGFDKSVGRFLFTDTVCYEQSLHEIMRNVQLLKPLGIVPHEGILPRLYPSREDSVAVDNLLSASNIDTTKLIGIAPGSVWNTKRWLKENYSTLAQRLYADGFHIILIGGVEDVDLCGEISSMSQSRYVTSSAGKLSLLQSAELIGRCRLLVSNDSAPMHLAVAMQTPVVAIFGATIPEFGFAPQGDHDIVVEVKGLSCRPCSSHGGHTCPISTFDCMKRILPDDVYDRLHSVLNSIPTKGLLSYK